MKNSNLQNNQSTAGFTLLEVLIAMVILVFISVATYQTIIETYKLRESLSTEGNFYNGIRLSTTILQRDISLIYSPLISMPAQKNNTNGPPQTTSPTDDAGQSSTFWSPAVSDIGVRPSHFIGTENKLSFIALSHIRIYKDSPESEFAKITYEIKNDPQNSGTVMLVKTESPNAFTGDDVQDTFSRSYEILHGIKKLTYTYYKRDGDTWKILRSWDSEREEPKNTFPDMIELKLEVVGPQKQSFEGNFKFRPEIPFNGLNPST